MKPVARDIKSDIGQFLHRHAILTLATAENNVPWVCTLYYGIDDDLNLYIVTDPRNVHGQQISKNPQVAFNVFDSHQKITKPKQGVQGRGMIEMVRGLPAITKGLRLWHQANPGIEQNIAIKDILKKITDTKVYRITPTYLKFFNKGLYGKDEYGIVEL